MTTRRRLRRLSLLADLAILRTIVVLTAPMCAALFAIVVALDILSEPDNGEPKIERVRHGWRRFAELFQYGWNPHRL